MRISNDEESMRWVTLTPMKLLVRARGASLPCTSINGSTDPLGERPPRQDGRCEAWPSPHLGREIQLPCRLVDDVVAEELVVSVLNEDKYFSNDLLEQVQVQLSKVMDAHDPSGLGT